MKTLLLSLTFLSVTLFLPGQAKADDSVDLTAGNTATMTGSGSIVTRPLTPKEKAQLKGTPKSQAGDAVQAPSQKSDTTKP